MSRAKAEKKRANLPRRLSEFKKTVATPDDWCPTIVMANGECVVDGKVFLDDYPREKLRYFARICFWGGDDMGRDLDFATNDIEKAKDFYEKWRAWLEQQTVVTVDGLKALGFVMA